MPSGSKKRKALKKKKEKEANSAPHSHHVIGEDDPKVREEKESDGGETNSPLSQDDQNSFAEGEDEKTEQKEVDSSAIQSTVTENKSVEGANGNGDNTDRVAVVKTSAVRIDHEIKVQDGTEMKDATIECVELEKKLTSSSSSSICSYDEFKVEDKRIEVINWEEPIEYAPNLPSEVAVLDDLEQVSDLPEITQVNNTILHYSAVEPTEEEAYEPFSAKDPLGISVKPADLPEMTPVAEAVPFIDDHDYIVVKSKVEAVNLASETIGHVDPVILTHEEVSVSEDFGVSGVVLKENGKNEISGESTSVIEMGSQLVKEIGSAQETVEEDECKALPQSSVAVVDSVNDTENKKEAEMESSDRQISAAFGPRPMQTTSWKGCCGLFELFSGSNR